MNKTEQQIYKFEEFGQHISLWNVIPAGQGNSLVLLRKIIDGIQGNSFSQIPSLLIAGEGAEIFSRAVANSLCSSDIREIDAKYLTTNQSQIQFFRDSLFETVNIVSSVGGLGLSESVLWHLIKNRVYKFSSYDRKNFEYIHVNGMIIVCTKDIKLVPPQIIKAVDFKVIIEPYTQEQLELIVHQRLKFCGIDYGDDGEVLKTIIEYGNGQLSLIIDFLKICILMAQSESREKINLKLVQRASRLF